LLSLAQRYNVETPLLKVVYHNLTIYEANRRKME
jgi:2-dehydropantoate 2-reductase